MKKSLKKTAKSKRKEKGNIFLKYSQNFLKSPKLVKKLIDKSSIGLNDVVYEIGPGKGIITEQLQKRRARVIAIEKDKNLYKKLRQKFALSNKVEILYGDFLQYKILAKKYKVFSNIPFNLTADIIAKLTSVQNPPEDAYLIIQKQAAQKFAGQPYFKERQYSLLLKPTFELQIIHKFKKTDFRPMPKVDIVLLEIKKRASPLVKNQDMQFYKDFIVYGFNQWQSTLKESFKKIFTNRQFNRLAQNLKFNLSAKPTSLTFQQWLGLFDFFIKNVDENKKMLIFGSEKKLKKQQLRLQKTHRTSFNNLRR